MTLLQIAYLLDIIVSVPVALTPLIGNAATARSLLGEDLPENRSMRSLLAALWMAILLCLVTGLAYPIVMAPILVLQLLYKSLWIVLFAVPRWASGRHDEVSWKLTAIFATYIVVYPWVIPWEALFAAHG